MLTFFNQLVKRIITRRTYTPAPTRSILVTCGSRIAVLEVAA